MRSGVVLKMLTLLLIASSILWCIVSPPGVDNPEPVAGSFSTAYPGVVCKICGEFTVGVVQNRGVWLKNTEDYPLAIQAVDVSCGCVRVLKHPRTILPGSKAQLIYAVNPANAGEEIRQRIFVAVSSAGGNDTFYEIQLVGFSSGVIAQPARLYFGAISPSAESVSHVVLVGRGVNRMKIRRFDAPLDVSCIVVGAVGKVPGEVEGCEVVPTLQQLIRVELDASAQPGVFRRIVRFEAETDQGEFSEEFDIEGIVQYSIACEPERLVYADNPGATNDLVKVVKLKALTDDVAIPDIQFRSTLPGLLVQPDSENVSHGQLEIRFVPPEFDDRYLVEGRVEGFLKDRKVMDLPVLVFSRRLTK